MASAKVLSAQEMDMSPGMQGMEMKGRKGPKRGQISPLLVETPDVAQLPWRMDGNVKEFHLIAEPVKQEIFPGRIVDLWGYNGRAPGPTIQVNQGDRVRIIVDNHLPEATSMHWHGFEVPSAMDGAPGSSQDPIPPGGRFVYEFTLHQEGTYFYHSHMAMQEMMGMIGAFIMHPKEPYKPRADKDFAIIMQEYAILPNIKVPNSMNMEFNWLTFNGKSGPANTPLIVRHGERVRIRLINLGMDHHPIHLHVHQFVVTGTEGGRQPQSTWGPGNTVLVGVAQSRDVEFVAADDDDAGRDGCVAGARDEMRRPHDDHGRIGVHLREDAWQLEAVDPARAGQFVPSRRVAAIAAAELAAEAIRRPRRVTHGIVRRGQPGRQVAVVHAVVVVDRKVGELGIRRAKPRALAQAKRQKSTRRGSRGALGRVTSPIADCPVAIHRRGP